MGMLFLTKSEQLALAFIFVAFVAGAAIRHFRLVHMLPPSSLSATH
jgi:hypothetical protein